MSRVVAWFSCGAASAVAAKLALEKYGADRVDVVYCDTMSDEHGDNPRFFMDVEKWLGVPIRRLGSELYKSVDEVFAARKYMSGPKGAPCTVALKKVPRFKYQRADDIHVFGFTADEPKRIKNFETNNPDMMLSWVLRDAGVTKKDCYGKLSAAGIQLPAMYSLGYHNNNCLGCVKATSPAYWAKIKRDFPEVFARRAAQSRAVGCRLTRVKGKRIFLDELPDGDFGRYKMEKHFVRTRMCASRPGEMTMRTKNGLFVGPERTFSNNGPSNHTWVLASRHYPWSITWTWALYWTKPGMTSWARYLFPIGQWSMNGYGFIVLPLGFNLSWQPTMRREEK